ncbi:DNA binding domain-containing protein, excisionase family [Burkholderia sp. OK233]|nr:DNA binding domain-containing protein, excisionase family [Burkholderia sp. OK233]
MTVEEAAKYLFVSRTHIHTLLALGKLVEVLPRNPSGTPDIEETSLEAYWAERDAARRAYQDSQTEDNDPLGL